MRTAKKFPFNIIDLQFSAGKAAVIKTVTINTGQLNRQLRTIHYNPAEFAGSKLPNTENAEFPPFNLVFYRYIINNNCLPDAEQFINECLSAYFTCNDLKYKIKINGYDNATAHDLLSLKGRISRTYPSLIRDFHFYLLCSESGKFQKVEFSLRSDFFEGYDLKVTQYDQLFFISLHVATQRGNFFKQRKYERHAYTAANEIVLRLDLNKMEKINDIFITGKETLDLLINEIEKINKVNGTS
jgi:hypothetical protein